MVIAQQKKESKTVQEETNFTQAIDEWRKILQTFQDKKDVQWMTQKEKKADTLLAALQETKMMKTLKEKWSLPSESPMEVPSSSDDVDIESISTSLSMMSSKVKDHPRKCQRMVATTATADIVTAIGDLGKELSKAVIAMSEAISS